MRATLLLLQFAVLLGSCAVVHDELRPPTIQRPMISSATTTTAPGQLDFEGGVIGGDDWEVPAALRWGSGVNVETFLEMDVWRNRMDESGIGDLAVGVRHRISEDEQTGNAFAYQLRTKIPTADADKGLGSGVSDFDMAAIVDWSHRGNPVTTYYELGLLGRPSATGADARHTLAAAVTIPLEGRWDAKWEVAGIYSSGADISEVDVTIAGTYQASAAAVIDVGVRIGMGSSARDPLLFVGIGRALGRLVGVDPPR